MAQLRAVILDVDGTLVDSNDAHAQAWVDAFAEAGHTVDYTHVRRLIGKGGDKLMPEVSGVTKESEAGGRISDRRSAIFKERYLPRLRPFPRTRELLQRMRDAGLTLVVASSASGEELAPLLDVAGVHDLLEDQTSSSDAERSKPDPDIVQAALDKAGLRPDECLMLGDTPYDVEAAGRAGVGVVALRCGGWHDEELQGAVAVYADPAELLARYEQSPLAA
jgi:HAD superfamily hydrolase (TIGR01509 family)